MKHVRWIHVAALLALAATALHAQSPRIVQFVFTSDAHYGITRPEFRGAHDVNSRIVNRAMIARINKLPAALFPKDGGVEGGEQIGSFDFVAETGDIANREEGVGSEAIQAAAVSWSQFRSDYIEGLRLTDAAGAPSRVFVAPGNHDVSDAVGFYRPMSPAIDTTAMVEIYNRFMSPAVPKTAATYQYPRDTVRYSRDVGGLHLVFISVWPDSSARAWMEKDLAGVSPSTPVMIFTHDQPDVEAKHFINPNGRHDINATNRFENLLSDTFADGPTIEASSEIEQRALEAFLARHRNITAYLHGNSNWNQFYDWIGPDRTVVLHTFRADSPMKGDLSSTDERKLSFQVVTIDTASRLLTARECLWNADPAHPNGAIQWGGSTTVALQPRPAPRAPREHTPHATH